MKMVRDDRPVRQRIVVSNIEGAKKKKEKRKVVKTIAEAIRLFN